MKKIFSKIISSGIAGTVVVIALGLLLTFYPEIIVDTICYILGAICILTAGYYLYKCITCDHKIVSSFSALAYLALGVILIFFEQKIFEALPLTAGICLLVFSLLKLYTAFSFLKSNITLFKKMLIPPAINAILGIVLILLRSVAHVTVVRVIGVLLLYCACESIVTRLVVRADSNFGKSFPSNASSEGKSLQVTGEFSDSDAQNADENETSEDSQK